MKLQNRISHEFFCIYCSREREFKLPTDDPSAFIEGRSCENCGKDQWAYSPPATEMKSDY